MKKNYSTRAQFKCICIFLLVTLPVLFAAFAVSNNRLAFFTFNFLTGVLAWTYLEYHIHRFLTHSKRSNSDQLVFQTHKHHHKNPTEIKITAKQRMILFSVSAVLFTAAIFWNSYFTIFVGLEIGFAYSFFSHWILHKAWSKKLFPHLHQYHIHHHCKYPDRCFGFSTIFWDIVFRTTPPKNAVISERIIQFYYGHHNH
jgi:sterol desaturase/sphingolipid hydroxylase (fatty acid hydroxylase superfamily)